MVTVTCDVCGRKKPGVNELHSPEWVLGYDLQSESPSGVSRAIRFLDRWDDRWALELGAIHLCSETCREKYVRLASAA